ncbi:MAG: hypothetical protein PF638_16085 [Candidatus Delongbacteria bacterium]|jgi:uncharacterized protein (TIGR02646 family)|nr:hypothetical protein [Candidatus Delongbacteria bacterium]
MQYIGKRRKEPAFIKATKKHVINSTRTISNSTQISNAYKAAFDNLLDKNKLRLLLAEEQGYICCYCMKRIKSVDSRIINSRIEHYKCRDLYPLNSIDYDNLLLACDGNEKLSKKYYCCDKKKENKILSFNPQSKNDIDTIKYLKNGYIKSTNITFDNELNEILNLNLQNLVEERTSIIRTLNKKLDTKTGLAKKNFLKKLFNFWGEKDRLGKHKEYYMLAVCYLNKKNQRVH